MTFVFFVNSVTVRLPYFLPVSPLRKKMRMVDFYLQGDVRLMKQEERRDETTRAEKFVVRFPSGMRDWISETACASHRSMNAEIIARLRHSQQNWPAHLPMSEPAIPEGGEERRLLERFRQLPAVQRRALLMLLD